MNVSIPHSGKSSKIKKSFILMSAKMPSSFLKASITKGPQESIRGFFSSYSNSNILTYLYSRRNTYPDVDVNLFQPYFLSRHSRYLNGTYVYALELRIKKGKGYKTFFFTTHKDASDFLKTKYPNNDHMLFSLPPCIIISDDDVYIHPYAKKQIMESKKDLVVCYLQLRRYNKKKEKVTGHANMLIFDKKNGKVYRFEPHGSKVNTENPEVSKKLASFIKKQTKFKLEPLDTTCPRFGPQTKANAFDGMCLTWTALITHLYLMNFKSMSLMKIQTDLFKYFSKEQLLTLILKYNRHISKHAKTLHFKN